MIIGTSLNWKKCHEVSSPIFLMNGFTWYKLKWFKCMLTRLVASRLKCKPYLVPSFIDVDLRTVYFVVQLTLINVNTLRMGYRFNHLAGKITKLSLHRKNINSKNKHGNTPNFFVSLQILSQRRSKQVAFYYTLLCIYCNLKSIPFRY